ncbi:MAG: ATP-binding protein [Rhodospirillales bacterium]|nr:ATP-binding protein [Rhodospirillales bacterium]
MRANPAWLALFLGAPPLAALAALGLAGRLAWPPLFAAAAFLAALAAALLAWLWQADLDRLSAALERLGVPGTPPPAPRPRLPFLAPLAYALGRLSRRLAAEAARAEERRALGEAIVERLPDPVLVLDAGHRIARANEAARRAFGSELPAVLRQPEIRAAVARAQASSALETAEISLAVPVERALQAAVLPPDPAAPGRTVLVLSDRTRERAVERMRADFVANASHELRTPLASLIGFIETLRGPAADDPPSQARFLGIMAAEAARMQRLIDDLLSLSRIEMVEHQPPAGSIVLTTLLSRLVAGFEPRLAERHMQMALSLAADLPPVVADPDQLTQVVQNLLDNAVKYGREGGHVRLDAEPEGTGVAIAVADDGPGIPRQHLPRLTERFYRVDKGRSRAVGGTGLGLAIVKHIVNRHRGRLSIESSEGVGTTCKVWLPAAENPAAPPA